MIYTQYPKDPIRRIEDRVLEDSGRYQTSIYRVEGRVRTSLRCFFDLDLCYTSPLLKVLLMISEVKLQALADIKSILLGFFTLRKRRKKRMAKKGPHSSLTRSHHAIRLEDKLAVIESQNQVLHQPGSSKSQNSKFQEGYWISIKVLNNPSAHSRDASDTEKRLKKPIDERHEI
ncbi:hypothetical protein Tco_0601333 [Tanacetum coccineum]